MLYDCRQWGLERQLAEGIGRMGSRQSKVLAGFFGSMISLVGVYREA